MYQIPSIVWNQIAQEQDLQTEWARRMFNCSSQEELNMAVDQEAQKLAKAGVKSPSVRLSYIMMMPLLTERIAISNFMVEHPEMAGYRGGLPEVNTPEEALEIAKGDHLMSAADEEQLLDLLTRAYDDAEAEDE